MKVKIRIYAHHNGAQWSEEAACGSLAEARVEATRIFALIEHENADAAIYHEQQTAIVAQLISKIEDESKCIVCGNAKLINYGYERSRVPLCREHNRHMHNLEKQCLVGPYNWAEKVLYLRDLSDNVKRRDRNNGLPPAEGSTKPRTPRKRKDEATVWEEI